MMMKPAVKVPTLSTGNNTNNTTATVPPYNLTAAASLYRLTHLSNSATQPAAPTMQGGAPGTFSNTAAYTQGKTLMDYYFHEPCEVAKATSSAGTGPHQTASVVNAQTEEEAAAAAELYACEGDRRLASADFVERLVQEMRQSCQLPCSPTENLTEGGNDTQHYDPFTPGEEEEEEGNEALRRLIKSPTVSGIVLGRPTIDALHALPQRGGAQGGQGIAFPFTGNVNTCSQERRSRSPSPVLRRETAVSLSPSTVRAVSLSARSSPTRRTHCATTAGSCTTRERERGKSCRCTSAAPLHTPLSLATRRLQRAQTDTQLVMPPRTRSRSACQTKHKSSEANDDNDDSEEKNTVRVVHPSWAAPPPPRHRPGWNQRRPPPRSRPVVSAETYTSAAQHIHNIKTEVGGDAVREEEGRRRSARLSRTSSLARPHQPASPRAPAQKEEEEHTKSTKENRCVHEEQPAGETSPTRVLFPHTSEAAVATAQPEPRTSPTKTAETGHEANGTQPGDLSLSPAALRVRLSELEHTVRVAVQRATSAEAHAARLEERLRLMQAAQEQERTMWVRQHGELTGQLQHILQAVQMLEQPSTSTSNNTSSNHSTGEQHHVVRGHESAHVKTNNTTTAATANDMTMSPLTPQMKEYSAGTKTGSARLYQTVPHTVPSNTKMITGQQHTEVDDYDVQGITPSPAQVARCGSDAYHTESSVLRVPPSPPMLLQLHVK